nr:insulinase family protein [Candidatus Kapabacteria bacterium]
MRTLRKALTPFLVLVGFSLCVGSLDLSAQKKSTKKSTNKSKSTTKASPAQQKPTESQTIVSLDAKPEPLEATAFSFPKYEEFTLANGLHVYVIENHEQPLITASIIFKGGEAADPLGKEGVAAIAGDMLSKGAGGRSAKEIARTLDGVGASISASAGAETFSVSASGLKKHASLFVSVLSDMLLKPTFPGEELDKLRQQYVANIASQKSRPSELGQALARKVIYGINSPLARRKTEKSIASITRDDLIAFHKAYVNPNNASIAIVGDVTAKEVRQLLSAHLERWEKSTVPKLEIPPIETAPAGVYFIPRKGAVQSMVIVTAAAPAQRDADYESVDLMTGFLASGFGSRLFATLRETYSYTYSPFGFVTQGKHYNRIAVGAEVRTSVTDSALTVIQREIALLGANGPDPDDLERRKAFEIGQYRLAFEQASTVASLLQYAWANERPLDDVLTQTEKIEALTAADVQRAARTYFNMFAQRVVVVGDPSIRERLEAFGPVKEFTMDIEPAAAAAYEPVQQTVADIIALYERALGGRQAVDAVTSTTYSGTI